MGVALGNVAGDHQHLNWASYRALLELAHEYGWQPTGTEPGQWCDPETGELDSQLSPDPDEWDGTYVSNDYQWVTKEDAANIAEALERALEDKQGFGNEAKHWIRDFIAFCRGGDFYIA